MITHFFKRMMLQESYEKRITERIKHEVSDDIMSIKIEERYDFESGTPLTRADKAILADILVEPYEPRNLSRMPILNNKPFIVGTRLERVTPLSSEIVSICHACGVEQVTRAELFRHFEVKMREGKVLSPKQKEKIYAMMYDRMTERPYDNVLETFDSGIVPEPVRIYPICKEGIGALRVANEELKLSLSEALLQYTFNYYTGVLKRNPTDVILFKFAQLNSEHCRHHRFKGIWIVDGITKEFCLFDMVKRTAMLNPGRMAVAFSDNAAALEAEDVLTFVPMDPLNPSEYVNKNVRYSFLFKVETHNHPTSISPYEGAATGMAVRRDIFGFGRGGIPLAHLSGYYTDNLWIPGYRRPWEKRLSPHPSNLAYPVDILIEGSDGAADNCNCFGNPLILGTFRTFGQMVRGVQRGYTKCVLLAGSCGEADERHHIKEEPETGMYLVQIGGDGFPNGLRGGSNSSDNAGVKGKDLDFASVQRANPKTEQLNSKVFKTCVELGDENPISAATDLGAGGDAVAPPELVGSAGGRIEVRKIPVGDKTMNVMAIIGNEAQERNLVLIRKKKLAIFLGICERFGCNAAVIGRVTGDGKYVITDSWAGKNAPQEQKTPVDVHTKFLLEDLPRMTIKCEHSPLDNKPLILPHGLTLKKILGRVFRLEVVGSKMFLIIKGDRNVGGRVAQQQAVGPLQLPLSDYAIVANDFTGKRGNAMAIGEQPIKGLVYPQAGGRMSTGEALTNLVFGYVDDDVYYSTTWQWACGQPGEDAALFDTVEAVTDLVIDLGHAIIVGKDSVSMTAMTMLKGKPHAIVAPGTVQMIAFGHCSDISKAVTPDIKMPGKSKLMFVDLAAGKYRLGGSALAQVHNQIGDESPDVNTELLKRGRKAIKMLLEKKLILSGHDRSDGGLITCLTEMAFGGNCGMEIHIPTRDFIPYLFNEELGLVFEYLPENRDAIMEILDGFGLLLAYRDIATSTEKRIIHVVDSEGATILKMGTNHLRKIWEETSYRLARLQSNPDCADEERKNSFDRKGLSFKLSFTPTVPNIIVKRSCPKVLVLDEEGTNGQIEMAKAFSEVGFKTTIAETNDILKGKISLDKYRGFVPAGGFTFSDALGAGKALAKKITHNPVLEKKCADFKKREDTFSLGICNGCQMISWLGWVPFGNTAPEKQPRFVQNKSENFESRFSAVKLLRSQSIFTQRMEGSVLGIPSAHGEGRGFWPDKEILKMVLKMGLAPMRFVDDNHRITTQYPDNPNGSEYGIAGLCSLDGRHNIFMPHPERAFMKFQWLYWPQEWENINVSPWLMFFENAMRWCIENQ